MSTLASGGNSKLAPALSVQVEHYVTIALILSSLALFFVCVDFIALFTRSQMISAQMLFPLIDGVALAMAVGLSLYTESGNEERHLWFVRYFPVMLIAYGIFIALRGFALPAEGWAQIFGAIPLVGFALIGWMIKKSVDRALIKES